MNEAREKLAESGEALAQAAQKLRSGEGTVEELFDAAGEHMNVLNSVMLPHESFATGVMTVLTAFGARFNPEKHSREYLMMLLRMAMDAALSMQVAMQQGDTFAMQHYEAIDAELGPLLLHSYRELNGAEALPEGIREPFEQLEQWVDAEATFQDKPITAHLAPDILYDIASRLTAMGVIE